MNHRHSTATIAVSTLFCLVIGCGAPAADPTPPTKGGSTNTPTANNDDDSVPTPNTPTTPVTDPLPAPPAEAGACKLADASAQDLQVAFTSGTPPAATGGTLEGTYVVQSAKVYLPNGAQPAKSTGTINAWGVFEKGNYNLSMKVDLSVATIIGTQAAKQDVVGQGTFTTQGEKVIIATSCEGSQKPDVDVSFTSVDANNVTLYVKAVQSGQTVYIELQGKKS